MISVTWRDSNKNRERKTINCISKVAETKSASVFTVEEAILKRSRATSWWWDKERSHSHHTTFKFTRMSYYLAKCPIGTLSSSLVHMMRRSSYLLWRRPSGNCTSQDFDSDLLRRILTLLADPRIPHLQDRLLRMSKYSCRDLLGNSIDKIHVKCILIALPLGSRRSSIATTCPWNCIVSPTSSLVLDAFYIITVQYQMAFHCNDFLGF